MLGVIVLLCCAHVHKLMRNTGLGSLEETKVWHYNTTPKHQHANATFPANTDAASTQQTRKSKRKLTQTRKRTRKLNF